jgi:pimeloyl-ACP methyl ester carboxylesterase
MQRWARRVLVGVCSVVVVAACAGTGYQWLATLNDLAATPPPGRLVDIGGHRLHLWCTGDGSPVVILDTGLGSTTAAWGFVQPDVARFTRVCSYDRAGLGYSDAGPTPRTARRMASELAGLLDRGGIGGPVVLVAASSGGFNVRMFASDHPERTAALVLVDAAHEDQPHDIPRLAAFVPLLARLGVLRLLGISFDLRGATLAPSTRHFARATRFRAAGYAAAADEIRHIRESATEVRNSRRALPIPVVVVTGALGADAAWHALQRDLVALSERGCQIIVPDAGHVVALDQPQVIVSAIRSVVEMTRGRSDVPLCGTPPAGG